MLNESTKRILCNEEEERDRMKPFLKEVKRLRNMGANVGFQVEFPEETIAEGMSESRMETPQNKEQILQEFRLKEAQIITGVQELLANEIKAQLSAGSTSKAVMVADILTRLKTK